MSTYVCTAVDGEDVAVAIEDVEEIAELGEVVELPGASPPVAGLTDVRGAIVTVVGLGARSPEEPARRRRILVLRDRGRGRVGLRIGTASVQDLTPDASGGPQRPFTRGQVLDGNRTRWIVDAGAATAASTDDPGVAARELDVLVAQRGRHRVAVPIASVERVARAEVPDVDPAATPLEAPASESGPAIVVAHAGRQVALACDRLLGERALTVAPVRLGTTADGAYLGAAVDDPGGVVLVLDPAALVRTTAPAGRP